jgi:tRNA A37 N6-isopentenylltransferase MiaA
MVTLEQIHDGQTRRATITRDSAGWHYLEQCDSQVVRQTTYTDWHRVERAMQLFELEGGAGGQTHSTKR